MKAAKTNQSSQIRELDPENSEEWKKFMNHGEVEHAHHSPLWTQPEQVLRLRLTAESNRYVFLPHSLAHIWKCSPMQPDKYHYWWRAMSAAYILRPNEPTLKMLQKYRTLDFDQEKEKCVSVYVRRGDKHLEMQLIEDFTAFFDSAKLLWQNMMAQGAVEKGAPGVMFLGSEDPEVIDAAKIWGTDNNFKILYTELFDRRSISTHLNSTMQKIEQEKKQDVHADLEYFMMVLNLDYHARCSAFVCTMRSNFCRVIDELRATVGGKADKQLIEMICRDPPCLDRDISPDWRRN
jgi:glycine cleavage system regulatory protein